MESLPVNNNETAESPKSLDLEPGDILMYKAKDHVALVADGPQGRSLAHAYVGSTRAIGLTPIHPRNFPGPFTYLVFRCRNTDLAKRAATIASKWCAPIGDAKMPFASADRESAIRETARLRAEKYPNWQDRAAALAAGFRAKGRFRAIKFAARRDLRPIHLAKEDLQRAWGPSFTCEMFVTVCYQVAGLAEFVDACTSFDTDWVSNKHGVIVAKTSEPASDPNQEAFTKFVQAEYGMDGSSVSVAPSKRVGKTFASPLSKWHGGELDDFPFEKHLTAAMCVDAKGHDCADMFQLLAADPEWRHFGAYQSTKLKPSGPLTRMD